MNNNDIPNQQYILSTNECARIMNHINSSKTLSFNENKKELKKKEIQLALCNIWIQKFKISHAAKNEMINLYCNVWLKQHSHNPALIQEYTARDNKKLLQYAGIVSLMYLFFPIVSQRF